MVARRMGSQEGGTNRDGGAQTETQILSQNPHTSPLARQGSLYSLTLDEVQNQLSDLGKPLSSMNLDELLKSVWTAETNNQLMEGAVYETATHQPAPSSSRLSLNQNPGLTLPVELSKKTVDEVWQDIQDGQKRSSLDRKATLGEITLEDFLVKAGIVAEPSGGKKSMCAGAEPVGLPQQTQWMGYQVSSVHSQPQLPTFMPSHQTFGLAAYPETQISMSSSSLMGTLSDTQMPGRKRDAPDGIAEKSVERRQKRMIKNRESAARSRARKQAYTHELESKVSRLEEENEKLRRQQELEKLLVSIPTPEPRYQLRRTSSSPL